MCSTRLLLQFLTVLLVGGCTADSSLLGPRTSTGGAMLSASDSPANDEYRLATGDVISIRVYGEEDLRFDRIRLNEVPTLTFPFGDLQVHGRTPKEVEAAITKTLQGRLLLKPRVWVNIEEYRPFFTQGQVARPGSYPYQPGLTVSRAIIIAGGFRERAAKNKIFLVRDKDKKETKIPVDPTTPVRPGDTVIVEESFF